MSDARVPMRCGTCGRFRGYRDRDRFCIVCGSATLSAECACGRPYDFALDEPPDAALHCPRCGRDFRGASASWEPPHT